MFQEEDRYYGVVVYDQNMDLGDVILLQKCIHTCMQMLAGRSHFVAQLIDTTRKTPEIANNYRKYVRNSVGLHSTMCCHTQIKWGYPLHTMGWR